MLTTEIKANIVSSMLRFTEKWIGNRLGVFSLWLFLQPSELNKGGCFISAPQDTKY
jgi:hypothetical protein